MKVRLQRAAAFVILLALVLFPGSPRTFAQVGGTVSVVTVTATDPTAVENSDNAGVFTVSRTGDLSNGLQVFFQVSGTARSGVDYQPIAGSVIVAGDPPTEVLLGSILVPPGSPFAVVNVVPLNDNEVEGTETVQVTIVPPPTAGPLTPYLPGDPSHAVVSIEDNVPTNKPPAVRLVMPAAGAEFGAPANILLAARAEDPDGDVKTVEFFAGDHSLGVRTNLPVANPLGPFVLEWNNVEAGEYTLTARATDDLGGTTVSEPVKIVVKSGLVVPVVNIEATDPEAAEIPVVPPWLGMPQQSNPGSFTVWRGGDTSVPLEVHYRIGGTALNGTDYQEIPDVVVIPASSSFATIQIWPVDDGLVEDRETVVLTLEPRSCDATQPPTPGCYSVGSLAEATVYILDNDSKPNASPTVRLLSPPTGAQFTAPANMVLTALARDEDGWVTKVEFFAGDRSLGMVENSLPRDRFYLNWNDVTAGEYTLTARATDNFGATRASDPVHIVVRGGDAVPFVFIPKGAVWKYLDDGSDPGTAWRQPGFNDDIWRSGPAQLGFGDGDEATLLNPGPAEHRTVSYFFRRAFDATAIAPSNLILDLLRDDGAVVYVNGTEVFRSNLPEGPITYQTLALGSVNGDAEHVYYTAPVDPALLRNTGNVVAVEVHQVIPASADLSFDLELLGNAPPPPNHPPSVAIVAPRSGAVFFTPVDIAIRAEAADADGVVKRVDFYSGDRLLGTDETAPYSLVWSNVPAGEYVLSARATDDDGAASVSSPGIKIVVRNPPPEQAIVNIEATDPEAAEISPLLDVVPNPATFTVTRNGGTNLALTVYYDLGGTAQNGVDYEKLSGEVVIPEGAWSAPVVVRAIDDSLMEGTESVVIELRTPVCPAIYPPPPECYLVGEHGRAEARILDDDTPPPNLPPLVRIVQPLPGSVFRAPAEVKISALVRDPDGWVGLVQFFANDRKIGEQYVVFIQAPPPGELQTFCLDWSQVPVGDYTLVAKATDDRGAVGTSEPVKIRVVESTTPPPVVTIYTRDGVAREGTNAAGVTDPAAFVVRRNDGTNTDLTVFYSIRGTAENGVDYVKLPGTVTIPAGHRSVRVNVIPVNDTLKEKVESVVVKLEPDPSMGPVPRYTVGWPGKAAAVILDNDARLPHCQWLADGLFQFCFPGTDGSCFRMESSTDLQNWITVDTGRVENGEIHFFDPEAMEHPNRFYRLVPEIYVDLDE